MQNIRSIRSKILMHHLDPGLSLEENLRLIEEQVFLERLCLYREVKALRSLLASSNILNTIDPWEDCVDAIYNKLYFYNAGVSGRLLKLEKLRLPFSYRRTVRSFFS